MTALPVTKDQIENFKTSMELRKKVYQILKSGDLDRLDDEAHHIMGMPSFSYRDVLNLWKTELESCSNDKQFLKSLGVKNYLNPDFSLLGLNPKKLPEPYNMQEFIRTPQKDLDVIWKEQDLHKLDRVNDTVDFPTLEDPGNWYERSSPSGSKLDKVLIDGPGDLKPEDIQKIDLSVSKVTDFKDLSTIKIDPEMEEKLKKDRVIIDGPGDFKPEDMPKNEIQKVLGKASKNAVKSFQKGGQNKTVAFTKTVLNDRKKEPSL